MEKSSVKKDSDIDQAQKPAIRFLVESALRTVNSKAPDGEVLSRDEWLARLCEALMSQSEDAHHSVVAGLKASGVPTKEIFQFYVPSAARVLGELWVSDQASFVDVTVGASRLQGLFREQGLDLVGQWTDRSIPLGQSVLMVIPEYEHHALGAFVVADSMRRHGLWVHMAIGLKEPELAELVRANRFGMIGISLATKASVDKTTEMIDSLRANVDFVPPIVIGGFAVEDDEKAVMRTGADFAVKTVREAIEKCNLTTMAEAVPFERMGAV